MGLLDIRFFTKGKLFASRGWHSAPRIGDEVMLGPHEPKTVYRVVRIVWGVEGKDEIHKQCVNIEIEKVK
ncbi:MAG: hypothetical protein KAI73_07685 [Rhodospirillaceae bacterium]|nr:hypothetical protein [Rhodospirillaceae bacterium]